MDNLIESLKVCFKTRHARYIPSLDPIEELFDFELFEIDRKLETLSIVNVKKN